MIQEIVRTQSALRPKMLGLKALNRCGLMGNKSENSKGLKS